MGILKPCSRTPGTPGPATTCTAASDKQRDDLWSPDRVVRHGTAAGVRPRVRRIADADGTPGAGRAAVVVRRRARTRARLRGRGRRAAAGLADRSIAGRPAVGHE